MLLETKRLLLKPLTLAAADQIQEIFERVRPMVLSAGWAVTFLSPAFQKEACRNNRNQSKKPTMSPGRFPTEIREITDRE